VVKKGPSDRRLLDFSNPTLTGHSGSIRAVAFSPDGRHIESSSKDQTIKLWDTTTGDLQKTLTSYADWVRAVAFSPDSRYIASGSFDRMIKLWDATTGNLQRTLTGHPESVTAVAFSSDGKQIASGSYDQTIKLWDVAKVLKVSRLLDKTVGSRLKFRAGQEIKTSQEIKSLKFSADGQHLATNLGLIKIERPIDVQSPESKLKDLWIRDHGMCYGELPVFLLPSDFRQQCHNVKGDQVTVAFSNGRVLNFDINRLSLNSIFKNSV
jgi:WD40 repeat protein